MYNIMWTGFAWFTIDGVTGGAYVMGMTFSDEAGLYANLSDVTNFAQTNVAEEISANYEVQDDINFSFGNDDDFLLDIILHPLTMKLSMPQIVLYGG